MPSLTGRTVLVTGAASGIGRAIATAAAQSGARLILGDCSVAALEDTAQSLSRSGAQVLARACDVRKLADLEALASAGSAAFSPPDIVYANAGIEGPLGAPWDCSDEDFTRVLDINVAGIWRTMKVVLPAMVARGSGAIVATSSAAGLVGAAGLAAYVASKHGVIGLVRSVAASVASTGVRVNALCPGMVATAMLDRLTTLEPALHGALLTQTPMGRLGRLEEIATAALWLGSDESSYVTGSALAIDGGYTCQ
jgi:NAD(P)-dependent dehydrogenase (short-subunit alcohol dehydrogenase family)